MTKRLYLRSVEMSDADLILEWVNDPMDRANSFSSDPITLKEHIAWLESALQNSSMRLYVMMLDDQCVGHIKLKIEGKAAEIGYCVAPEWRGIGLAKAIVALVVNEVKQSLPEVKMLTAQVRPANIASVKALEANGYELSALQYQFDMDSFDAVGEKLSSIVSLAEARALDS